MLNVTVTVSANVIVRVIGIKVVGVVAIAFVI